MIALKGLHALAAGRGDGLRHEFLELLARHEALGAANVEDISIYLADHFLTQAGPNPVKRADAPGTVCLFPLKGTGEGRLRASEKG